MAVCVRARFEELYGYPPEGVWAAPGRVNLIGEYTDVNDGFVLPFALPQAAVAAVARRTDGVLRLHSADQGGRRHGDAARGRVGGVVELAVEGLAPGSVPGWAAYPAAVVWALGEAGHRVAAGGADVHLASAVPMGAGLSSSAALEVVLALALAELHRLGLGREQLALLAQRAENDFVGVPCGVMDQMASVCGTSGHALLLDTRDLAHRQIPFDPAAHGLGLLLVDTRVRHALGDGAYARRRAGCEAGARALGVRALREICPVQLPDALRSLGDAALAGAADTDEIRRCVRHVVTDNARVLRTVALLDAGDLPAVGPVLTEGHASLRDDLRVSCAELDLAVSSANAAGALGARMTGGGFGGSAIVLAGRDTAGAVGDAVARAFAAAGYAAPGIFPVTPSSGARRLE
ncbi:galactokinase [Streptomyces sp. NPDC059828]|uniref:galactokinase n=1 Tax=Streptomyces sp. NPDC059828 TaxID=3346965 RepID=UPI00364CDEDD